MAPTDRRSLLEGAVGAGRAGAAAGLFWHCLRELSEGVVGEVVAEAGLAAVTPVLRRLLTQILAGR